MSTQPKSDPLQTFDDASHAELGALIRGHRQAVLATLNLDGGAPYTAMTAYALAPGDGFPGLLVHLSNLSPHKAFLRADPRAGFIIFEPDDGRREILQHRRVSLDCTAEFLPKDGAAYAEAKAAYLARFPGHQITFTLADFDLIRLVPARGLMNAGFGRAYPVTPEDLVAALRQG